MRAILALFAKSPFKPIQAHMLKAIECVDRIQPLFNALVAGERQTVQKLVDEICTLESEADSIKNDLRGHLPKSIFLPIDRRDLLEILDVQDSIADTAQDIAVLLTLRDMPLHPELKEPLDDLVAEVTGVCRRAAEISQRFDELVQTSFRGDEAAKVLEMIERLNSDETVADSTGIAIAKKLFTLENEISPVDTMLWFRVFSQIGELANLAERMGNRLRLLIAK